MCNLMILVFQAVLIHKAFTLLLVFKATTFKNQHKVNIISWCVTIMNIYIYIIKCKVKREKKFTTSCVVY